MCGLFGVVVTTTKADRRHALALRTLAHFNQKRGSHSYGLWNSKGLLLKQAKDIKSHGLEHVLEIGKTMTKQNDWVMGHTRQATSGAVEDDNAHPFVMDGITLAHNGVVTVDGYTDKDHPVDSARILMASLNHGWVKGMSKVSGSCGLIVTAEEDVYLYRHNQTLCYAQTSWGLLVSSDIDHLRETNWLMGESPWDIYTPDVDKFFNLKQSEYTMDAPCAAYKSTKGYSYGEGYEGDRWPWADDDRYSRKAGSSVKRLTVADTNKAKAIANKLAKAKGTENFVEILRSLSVEDKRKLGDLYHDYIDEEGYPTKDGKPRPWSSDLSGNIIHQGCNTYRYYSDAMTFHGTLMWDTRDKCLWLIDAIEMATLRNMYKGNAGDLDNIANGYYPQGYLLHVLEIMLTAGICQAPSNEESDDAIVGPLATEADPPNVETLVTYNVKDTQPLPVVISDASTTAGPIALPMDL